MIKVIAFDLFGTVFSTAGATRADFDHYVSRLKAWRTEGRYMPVREVESFRTMKPFDDSVVGLEMVRRAGYKIVAASNIPKCIVEDMSRNAGIEWDAIMEFERYAIYKPSLAAYAAVCDLMKCEPSEVLFVTGNHGAAGIGDDIEPLKIGMQTAKIRRDSSIQTIIDLAATLTPTGEPT